MRSIRTTLVVFAFVCLSTAANAATRTWTGAGANSLMSNPANWAENAAPVPDDDLIFPAASAQYTVVNDVLIGGPPLNSFRSMTVQGGNYSFGGNGLNLGALTTVVGNHDFGYDTNLMHVLGGPIYVGDNSTVKIRIYIPRSHVTIDGPGTSYVKLTGSASIDDVTKKGTGTLYINYVGANVDIIDVRAGRVVGGGGSSLNDLEVVGGIAEGLFSGMGVAHVSGPNAELATFVSANTLEFYGGAKFSPNTCQSAALAAFNLDLRGGVLNPRFTTCVPGSILIEKGGTGPVTGTFANYPEGSVLTVGGQRLRITYKGGDGNDVQLLPIQALNADFSGDLKADMTVFRPPNATWYVGSDNSYTAMQWGVPSDKIVPADYDGDGKTDVAVYRPTTSVWYIANSAGGNPTVMQWGALNDIAAPGDFDGDGKADVAIFRPADGNWWINQSSGAGTRVVQYGQNGDIPVVADYDGDGRSDLAVFRPSNGTWYIQRSATATDLIQQFGSSEDKPTPADYDGDGKADISVYRPSTGRWFQVLSRNNTYRDTGFGSTTDIPVPADYDGDGTAEIAIYRGSDSTWWINGSSGVTVRQFGTAGDLPAESAYIR